MFETILGVVVLLLAVAIVVLVLMQSGKGKDLSGAIAGGNSNSYLGNSKSGDHDKLLSKITCVLAVVLVLLVFVLYLIA